MQKKCAFLSFTDDYSDPQRTPVGGFSFSLKNDGFSSDKFTVDCLCHLKRPRYAELKVVMEQIPDIQRDSLEQFDTKLLNPSLQKMADKRRKDNFKRLIAGCIGVSCAPKSREIERKDQAVSSSLLHLGWWIRALLIG